MMHDIVSFLASTRVLLDRLSLSALFNSMQWVIFNIGIAVHDHRPMHSRGTLLARKPLSTRIALSVGVSDITPTSASTAKREIPLDPSTGNTIQFYSMASSNHPHAIDLKSIFFLHIFLIPP